MVEWNKDKVYIIRNAKEEELHLLTDKYYEDSEAKKILTSGGWIVKNYNKVLLVVPDFDFSEPNTYKMFVIIQGGYEFEGTAYEGSEIEQAVRDSRFRRSLNPETLSTLEDLINEL